MNKIELRGVRKSFGQLEVIKGIDLVIPTDKIITLTGASGAGKTTLLQIMGTLDTPDTGSVLYDDLDVTSLRDKKLSEFRGKHIGFVFQTHQLLPEFNAQENVMLPALIAGVRRKPAAEKATELLKLLGLGERLSHKPSALSGGERQRVAVARALVNDPDIVFADEPTGSLDSHNRDEIIALFQQLHANLGQGFVIVTHDPELAATGHEIIHIKDGLIQPA
ncbi:MAG: ABC transporter ATP-binding protein [Lachnospiraceae bacterium]|nr:ABC transporter ATP-binding protein [Prevotella sp.]MCM1075409.1 ABC transporter ATP-binding protein [Ruminococcus sp.]MCM1222829.1 ABC transporter ATP-binding protein [Lachnospiraceae bacterium]